jgi:hypothetical protein
LMANGVDRCVCGRAKCQAGFGTEGCRLIEIVVVYFPRASRGARSTGL